MVEKLYDLKKIAVKHIGYSLFCMLIYILLGIIFSRFYYISRNLTVIGFILGPAFGLILYMVYLDNDFKSFLGINYDIPLSKKYFEDLIDKNYPIYSKSKKRYVNPEYYDKLNPEFYVTNKVDLGFLYGKRLVLV